jgi:DNA-binding NtrC family response regulator
MPNWIVSDDEVPAKSGTKRGRGQTRAVKPTARDKAGPARILIVEDDFFVSLEIEAAVADAGFEVAGVVNSAEDAERYAAETRPDLIVMDIRLATERDGIDAALAIFRATGIRSIFATAHADIHTRERAATSLPLGWVAKPYAMPWLIKTIKQALKELKD